MPVRIIECLASGSHGKDDKVVDLALILRFHPLVGIERACRAVAAWDHAGDLAGQIRDVDGLELPGAALAVEDPLPGRIDATAQWRHHAEAGDDNSPHVLNSSPGLAACRAKPARPSTTRPARLSPRERCQLFAFFSRNFVASPTVRIVSAASSGISQPNSSSKAITSSTVSRLSAPRSSMKLALSVTF